VVTGSGTDANTVLDGFTISGGNANGSSPNDFGGGMYNSGGSPTVTNCTFIRNSANLGGGTGNKEYSSPFLTNCAFTGNSAWDGGGIYNEEYSSPTVTNCTFSGNWAEYGGGMYNEEYSSPPVTNCTFSGNRAGNYGGALHNNGGSSVTLVNSILWGDTATTDGNEISLFTLSTIDVNYCDIKGGQVDIYNDGTCTVNWGSGNINADPCFVNANGPDGIFGTEDDNLRLSPGSPCIDAGDNNSVPPDTTDLDKDGNKVEQTPYDLDNNPRFVDGDCNGTVIVDMGAYEFRLNIIGDFDDEYGVDFKDFAVFASSWLLEDGQTGYNSDCDIGLPADLRIDGKDLAVFVDNWLVGKW
jgi:hypothetical protein